MGNGKKKLMITLISSKKLGVYKIMRNTVSTHCTLGLFNWTWGLGRKKHPPLT